MNRPAISIVGLGKLGAPLAACFAVRGFRVIGVDANLQKVAALNRGDAPGVEPQLTQYLARCRDTLRATGDIGEAVSGSSATFVLVSTPSTPDGYKSLTHVQQACRALGHALVSKQEYHLVVIASTVSPSTVSAELIPILEAASGKRCGIHFGVCYSPEFLALGSVIEGFVRPDFALVGEFDVRSGDHLEAIYEAFYEVPTPIVRTTLVSAELAKLAFNALVATKISFANFMAQICERIPGADVDAVSAVLGHHRRLGPGFLKGALSYGGPCLPRDVVALERLATSLGVDAALAVAVSRVNQARADDLIGLVRQTRSLAAPRGSGKATIGILGLAFKPDTDVTETSPGLILAEALAAGGDPVATHDPIARPPLAAGIRRVDHATSCVEQADIVVVATPWPEYAAIAPGAFAGRIVIDCWRLLDPRQLVTARRYIPLGVGATTGVA